MGFGVNLMGLLSRPRGLLAMVVILGILAASLSGGTLAYFTSSASSTGNTFVAGTIAVKLTDSDETAQGTVTQTLTAANTSWKPGQTVTGPLTILNEGTLPMNYGISYTAADSGTQPGGGSATPTQFLTLAVKAKGTGNGAAADCTNALFGDATKWQSTVYAASALSTIGGDIIAAGSRALAAASNEALCFQVVFTNGAAGVENAAMGGTSTVAFAVTGQQQ